MLREMLLEMPPVQYVQGQAAIGSTAYLAP